MRANRGLWKEGDSNWTAEIQPKSNVESALKRLKANGSLSSSACIDTRYLRHTSSKCDRKISISGYSLTNCRMGILSFSLERQQFFFVNGKFWDVEDVKAVVHDNSTVVSDYLNLHNKASSPGGFARSTVQCTAL